MSMEEKVCDQIAIFRYTWPGKDESFICLSHSKQLKGIAKAIGMHLQLIPLVNNEQACRQKVA